MRLASLLFLPALLLQAQTQDLAPVLQAAAPEVDRLIQVFQPKIALDRAKGILPAAKPPCEGGSFAALQRSTQNYRALAGMHLLQARAATAAGAWEDAQQALGKGLAIAQENQANYNQHAQPTVESLLKVSADAEAFKAEKAAQIKELVDAVKNIKSNPLEILKIQQSIKEQEELIARTRQSVAFVTGAKKDLNSDIQGLQEAQQNLEKTMKAEKDALATFNTAKRKTGTTAWVTAALADKGNAAKYPTAKDQSDFLHRLLVLEPANVQIPAKLEGLRQGKLAFAPAKGSTKPAKKKK